MVDVKDGSSPASCPSIAIDSSIFAPPNKYPNGASSIAVCADSRLSFAIRMLLLAILFPNEVSSRMRSSSFIPMSKLAPSER